MTAVAPPVSLLSAQKTGVLYFSLAHIQCVSPSPTGYVMESQ